MRRNNCRTKIVNKKSYLSFDNIRYNACFCNWYNPQVQTLMNISNNLKKYGSLPLHLVPSGILSNKLYQAHNLISTYHYEIEKMELDKIRNKQR